RTTPIEPLLTLRIRRSAQGVLGPGSGLHELPVGPLVGIEAVGVAAVGEVAVTVVHYQGALIELHPHPVHHGQGALIIMTPLRIALGDVVPSSGEDRLVGDDDQPGPGEVDNGDDPAGDLDGLISSIVKLRPFGGVTGGVELHLVYHYGPCADRR